MTIDDPSSPPRTRREARAQLGSHRGVDPTGVNAFFQGAGDGADGAAQKKSVDALLGGAAEQQTGPAEGQESHEEPPTSTAMLRALFGDPEADEKPEQPETREVDAFTRAMFGSGAATAPVEDTAPASDPRDQEPDRTGVAGTTTNAGLAALFGGAPATVAPEPTAPEASGTAPFDPDDDDTRESPVITGIPGWHDESAAQPTSPETVDDNPAPPVAQDAPPVTQDGLPASLAFFAAQDAAAAAAASAVAAPEAAPAADWSAGPAADTEAPAAFLSADSLPDTEAPTATWPAEPMLDAEAPTAALSAGPLPDAPEIPAATAPDDLDTDLDPGLGLGLGLDADPEIAPAETAPMAWADDTRPATALTWIDTAAVRERTGPATLEVRTLPDDEPDLLSGMRTTPGWRRPRVLIPCGTVLALVGAYCATTLLTPLDNVAPTIDTAAVKIDPAPAAAVTWPKQGTAAVDVQGFTTAVSSGERTPIASVSKVASVLMVLEKLPLKPGEQGPSYDFDRSDGREYWQYLRSNQSALDVPVGGSLTEYQMLEGILLGSANNYIDRLADEIWGSKDDFASAAEQWLSDQGLDDTTIISPSGRDKRNKSTSADMIDLAEIAMRNPVFAEIVAKKSVELPGAGLVKNSNTMLAEDPGVVGLKTGTLGDDYNLLTAKDVKVGDSTVRLYAVALGQGSNKERVAVSRALYAGVEKTLAEQAPTVPKGTVVGTVDTIWGESSDLVTDSDARVVMWNGSTAEAKPSLDLGEAQKAGTSVGSLTVTGTIDTAKTDVSLKSTLDAPSAWWRLTHPLDLFGLNG